jgi:DNA-binding transcriptional ArsR family regulator
MLHNINAEELGNTAEIYRAIAHPLRLKIIDFIDKNERINVNKIYDALELEQSITSQHLKILRNANLVKSSRKGKNIFYQVNHDLLKTIQDATNTYLRIS